MDATGAPVRKDGRLRVSMLPATSGAWTALGRSNTGRGGEQSGLAHQHATGDRDFNLANGPANESPALNPERV